MHIYTYTRMYIIIFYVSKNIFYLCMLICIYIYIYIHTLFFIYLYIYTYTYKHIHIFDYIDTLILLQD
jgi:hypothetical protein